MVGGDGRRAEGVHAAAVVKGNTMVNTHRQAGGPTGAGMQNICSYTSHRPDSLHVIYRESLINLVNKKFV